MAFADLTNAMHAALFPILGEPVIVLRDDTACTMTGIFKADAEAVDVSTGVPVSTVQPVLEVRAGELSYGIDEGDSVVVQGTSYLVVDVRPDGHGVVKLLLHTGGAAYAGENNNNDGTG